MSTKETEESFDYEGYVEQHDPGAVKRSRGLDGRRRRMEAGKRRITIRIDADILEEFKQLVAGGRGYQGLINQALREWLLARGVKELIQQELPTMVREMVSSYTPGKKP